VFISERSADRVAELVKEYPHVFRCSVATLYKRSQLLGYNVIVHPFDGYAYTLSEEEFELEGDGA
jgi:hypothetical protein